MYTNCLSPPKDKNLFCFSTKKKCTDFFIAPDTCIDTIYTAFEGRIYYFWILHIQWPIHGAYASGIVK